MKLLLLAPIPPPCGGIASWTNNMVDYFKSESDFTKVKVLNTALKYRDILMNSVIHRFYYGILETVRIFRALQKEIKRNKPDIIHLTSSGSLALFKDFMILNITMKRKIPLIMHWHFGRIPALNKARNWEWKLINYLIRKSNASIVIDPRSFSCLSACHFSNVFYIPNPISLKLEDKIRLTPSNIPKDSGRVIFVGHVIKEKGIFELVEASANCPFVDELVIIGPYDDEAKELLAQIALKRGNVNWITFSGVLENDLVLHEMLKSQILVLPSYSEGFPIVILEAMAMSCSVLATDVGAVPEMLAIGTNKPCGICIPVKDTLKLTEAISFLINNQEIAKQMGVNGRERVLNNYSIKTIIKKYKSVWEEVLN